MPKALATSDAHRRPRLNTVDWLNVSGVMLVILAFAAVIVTVGTLLGTMISDPARVPARTEWRDVDAHATERGPAELIAAFDRPPSVRSSETSLVTGRPLLVKVEVPTTFGMVEQTIEFRLLRPDAARFWIADPKGALAPVPVASSAIRTEKGGFAVDLPSNSMGVVIFGEIKSVFPWKPKVFVWARTSYTESTYSFERQGGALIGSLLILALFSGVVALLNRDLTFLLFSGWLITSIRIAAINGGWDRTWIGIEVSDDLYLVLLRLSMAAYGFLTIAIFRSLFLPPDSSRTARIFFGSAQGSYIILACSLPLLTYTTFLKFFWLLSAISLSAIAIQLIRTISKSPTRVAGWYLASWATMIAGMMSEIGFQAGFNQIPGWINSQTGAIVSALTMSIALADKLKSEREGRLRAQAHSLKYLRKYEQNYNSMPIGLFSASSIGLVRLCNPTFRGMFGADCQRELSGIHLDELLGAGTFDRLRHDGSTDETEVELRSTCGGDGERWYLIRYASIDDGLEGSIQDVTARKHAEARLLHLVDHDSLTGVLNWRGLESTLRSAIQQTSTGVKCAIAYVELDRFKLINDLHGHAIGDGLLQECARRLIGATRASDQLARLADAFVVLLIDCPDDAVDGLSERIRGVVGDQPFEIEGKGLNLTASVGVVSIDASMTSIDAVTAADRACLEAKARGRNCVVKLTDGDIALRTHLEELRVVADLQQRIPTDKYFLEFQPIVALRHPMASLSYEVLIRMRDDDGRVVPPGKFIGAAERNGLMSQIDRWVLRNTLEWLDGHPSHRDRMSFATINISGASLNDTRFVDDAFSMIAEHPLAMPKLCFEITESVALHDLGSTRRFVDRVRMYGSKLALDDFGAGYTSFNYLKEIPADFIKIDGSFVKDINRNPANYAITRTIVELTHELGMRSIAEWAETPDTIASLYDLGVDYGQGFALARPLSSDVICVAESGGALVFDPQVIALLTERGEQVHMPRQRFTNETRVV